MSGVKKRAPSPDALILDVGEVAFVLRCSPSHVNKLIGDGVIPTVSSALVGRRHLVPRAFVDQLIADTVAAAIARPPAAVSESERALQVVRDQRAANGVRESSAGREGEGASAPTGRQAGSRQSSKKNTPESSPSQAALGGV